MTRFMSEEGYWSHFRLLAAYWHGSHASVRLKWLAPPGWMSVRNTAGAQTSLSNLSSRHKSEHDSFFFKYARGKISTLAVICCIIGGGLSWECCRRRYENSSVMMGSCFCQRVLEVLFRLPGPRRYENAAKGDLQAADFIFNSTNVTHLICGITANVAAALLYGSNFVPVRRIETGDGKPNTFSWWLQWIVKHWSYLCSPERYVLSMGSLCSNMGCIYGWKRDPWIS